MFITVKLISLITPEVTTSSLLSFQKDGDVDLAVENYPEKFKYFTESTCQPNERLFRIINEDRNAVLSLQTQR